MAKRRWDPAITNAELRESRAWQGVVRGIGAEIRRARTASGLTLDEAAGRAGIDTSHLARIEAGRLNPTLVTLYRITRGLGLDLGDLFAVERN